MFCPNCGKEVNNQDVFCGYCGFRLEETPVKTEEIPVKTEETPVKVEESRCPHCGFQTEKGDAFCLACGQRLQDTQSNAVTSANAQQKPVNTSAEKKPFNVMALIGFILSLVGMMNLLDDGAFAVTAIPALVLGILGLKESRTLGVGKGFAIAAIVIASVALGLSVLTVFFEIVFYSPVGGGGYDAWIH